MKTAQKMFEYIYRKEGIAPWSFTDPPKELVSLLGSGKIKPCKALDIGCGEGNICAYLASKGFDATGIDISRNAIKLAKKNADRLAVKCKFIAMDWKHLSKIKEKYDFIFDWRFLHEIAVGNEREKYVEIVSNLLNSGGKYLSVAFCGEFKKRGEGKQRKSPIGMEICLLHNDELERLYSKHFSIIEKKMIKLPQKGVRGGVTSYFFLMGKK
jgi:cyclopropane fatty-acyl-phospholipid synthase-like methyltransferase